MRRNAGHITVRQCGNMVISPERCKGCSKCARNCPVGAISGQIKEVFHIDTEKCIKCGACESSCAFGAIHVED